MNLTYPTSLNGTNDPAWIQFCFYDRTAPDESSPDDKISLYMPEQFAQPSTVSWDSEKLGFVGASVVDASRAAQGQSGIVSGSGAALGSIASSAMNSWGLIKDRGLANVGSAVAQFMGGNSLSAETLIAASTGKTPNPYLTMIFRGIDFRTFSFSFKFYPFKRSDCDTIHNIIKTFRRNALPDYEEGNTLLGYPKECKISYKWKKDDNPWLHKFKRSVCTAVDVDYTASGMFSVMRNGFPSEIVVSTKWSEVELVTRADVGEGY